MSNEKGKNTREKSLDNQIELLKLVIQFGWIREDEISYFTSLSQYQARATVLILAEKREINRGKPYGLAGYFITITTKGARRIGAKVPKVSPNSKWAHDCLTLQALAFLLRHPEFGFYSYVTDYQYRNSHNIPMKTKIHDVYLRDGDELTSVLETEWSRKSGGYLEFQTKSLLQKTRNNKIRFGFVSYPYPAEIAGVDHETSLINSFRDQYGSGEIQGIYLIRAHFDSAEKFRNCRPSWFELLTIGASRFTGHEERRLAALPPVNLRWTSNALDELGVETTTYTLFKRDIPVDGFTLSSDGKGRFFTRNGDKRYLNEVTRGLTLHQQAERLKIIIEKPYKDA